MADYFNPNPKKVTTKLESHKLSKLKQLLIKLQNYHCYHCKRWMTSFLKADLHHIRNRSLGGDDSVSNCVVLCRECHRLVHDGKIKSETKKPI